MDSRTSPARLVDTFSCLPMHHTSIFPLDGINNP